MGINDFREELISSLQKKMGEAVVVKGKDVVKNNGVLLHGIEISENGSNIAPCIYTEKLYERYQDGCEMDELIAEIAEEYENSKGNIEFDTDDFKEYERIRLLINGRLINTDRNRDRLKDRPHRNFLDLSLTYAVEFPLHEGVGSVQITDEHMRMWNVTEEMLYEQAMENMNAEGEAQLQSISEVLKEMGGFDLDDEVRAFPLYVLSNRQKVNGASQMVRSEVLKKAGEAIGKDYMIIPSSIHEVLLVPEDDAENMAAQIAGMVDTVNRTQVAEDEILSFHVYRYNREDGQVSIAA